MAAVGKKRVVALIGAFACAIALSVPIAAYAALQTNYAWYRGHENDASYSITSAGELAALSKLVNGTADYDNDGTPDVEPVSFEGKSIVMTGGTKNFLKNAIEPIGTADHPFLGAFDGSGAQINNFNLTISASDSAPVSNVGVFGYVGPGGSVSNVEVGDLGSISIERDSTSTDYITNVGMVVGYCAGTVTNCVNKGSLTIQSEVAQQSAEDFVPVRNVGGVVGQCVYDVSGCSNSGSVSISQTAVPDEGIEHAQLVTRVGGVVGLLGDESKIGTYDKHIYGTADAHGMIRDCANSGMVSVDTPKLSGLDRFGKQIEAQSYAVGGVVGYSQGSVVDCTNGVEVAPLGETGQNTGYVKAKNGNHVGGICGSLRGVLADNMNVAWADDGADGADPLVVSGCTNYGDVYASVTVGGIVGKASSYTTVTECLNSTKKTASGSLVDTYIVATRWNKPSPGGIVGTANGVVSYCANLGTVASAVWDDENARTMTTQNGYYAAGIVGMLTYFGDLAPANGGITTPVSEVYGCYNAGSIIAGANMRQRGIVGQNDGFTHDNVLVEGVVYNDAIVYGSSMEDTEASGTVGENRVYTAEELRGDKAAEAIAFLNSNSDANGWESYWIVPANATARGLNGGYPLLDRQDPWGDSAVLITDADVSLVKDAVYTGAESAPQVRVVLGGAELVANADYRVVPQTGAINPSTGRPYRASVVGLGRYAGTASQTVSYDIVAGDFKSCKVTVTAHTFDYEAHIPTADEVLVTTAAGTKVDPTEYTYKVIDEFGDEISPVDVDMYKIVVTANENSTLFRGSVEGTYRIKPANFMQQVKFDGVTIEHLGESYPWVDSKTQGESSNPTTTLPYTGVAVKPLVKSLTYKGHELVEGVDYKVLYGNSDSDETYMGDRDLLNMGKKGGSTIGCVTVSYIAGKKTNFTSYANMFFFITDTGVKADLSKATYKVEGTQVSDGQPLEPVEIFLGATKLAEGKDYTIAYEDNVLPGTAHFKATGIGEFEGELSGTFEIEEGSVYDILYEFAGTGSASSPWEATVVGAEYHSSRDLFDLVIPETVEHDGHTYTVVAIGPKAFGGEAANGDFAGSLANETKLKISTVTIPSTVRSIDEYAFGSSSDAATSPISEIVFAGNSQLQTIGERAFQRCKGLTTMTVPASVQTIGNFAFGSCTNLEELRFLAETPDLPSDVAQRTGSNGAFYACDGVVVRGYVSAEAVRAIAAANGGTTRGLHGGKNFTFSPFDTISTATISDVANQLFTGSTIEPAVKVKMGATELVEGEQYEVSYENNVNAGTAKVVVSGIGNYAGRAEKSFTIMPVDIAKAQWDKIDDIVFSGNPVDVSIAPTYLGKPLEKDADYSVAYADADGNEIEAPSSFGTYRVVVTGSRNFKGSDFRTFRIVTASIEEATVTPVGNRAYTGTAVEPDVVVRVGSKTLERDVDYALTYEDNKEVGQAKVHIRGVGGYSGERTVQFLVVPASIAKASVIGVEDVEATGAPVDFHPTVVLDGKRLDEGVDYTISYARAVTGESDDGTGSGAAGSVGTAGTAGTAGTMGLDGISSGENGSSGPSSANLVAATLAPGALGETSGQDTGAGSVAVQDLEAQEEGEEVEPTVGDTIDAPSEPGDYFLVVTGKGNYRDSASERFAITDSPVTEKVDLSSANVTVATPTCVYNGSGCKPSVSVSVGGVQLEEGTDYIVVYKDNVNVGTASVAVHGIGSYKGEAQAAFEVVGAEIARDDVRVAAEAPYTGEAVSPTVSVVVSGRSLVEGADFTVNYENNTDVGPACAVVEGMGGYSGRHEIPFNIIPADIALAKVEASSAVYSGGEQKPAVTVTLGGKKLAASDYDITYSDNINPGTASVVVKGKGNYSGEAKGSFTINQAKMSDATVSFASSVVYSGAAQKPAVTVKLGSVTLEQGKDYSVSYSSNVNVGKASVVVSGLVGMSGSVKKEFEITAAKITAITLASTSMTYTGKGLQPALSSVNAGSLTVPSSGYTVAYKNNVNAGTATATITGKGNFTGSVSKTFTISKAKVAKPSAKSFTYDGAAKVGVAAGTGYALSGTARATKAGTYKAAATLDANHVWSDGTAGAVSLTWKISAASIAKAAVTGIASKTYTGKAQTQAPKVVVGKATLKAGTDYALSYKNNVKAGTATVTIAGKGNYSGSVSKTFKIAPASVAKATVGSVGTQAYTGRAVNPSPKVVAGGRTLAKGTDYTLVYYNSAKKAISAGSVKAAGTYYVAAKGKGNYTGTTALRAFKVMAPSVTYRNNVQSIGWQSWRKDGAEAGTHGRSLRLEALQVKLASKPVSGTVQYRAHVQSVGWQPWVSEGQTAGIANGGKRMEAVQIRLTGEMAKKYDVYYRLHVQTFGWLGWAKNGAQAGSAGYSKRVEAMQVKIVPKGAAAPGKTTDCFRQK